MGAVSPELLAEITRVLGPARMTALRREGRTGAYLGRGPSYEALSFTERNAVWAGEADARAARDVEAAAAEAARAQAVQAWETARDLEVARFLAAYPGVDLSTVPPRVYPGHTYLPGQECGFCRGDRGGRRCLGSPECMLRYRAAFFARQGGLCPWCGEPLPADLGMTAIAGALPRAVAVDHIIPVTRGGPVHEEWNKQLLHFGCNASKGSRVTGAAFALAAEHGAEVLDFVAVCEYPAPAPPGAVVHLFPPLRPGDGYLRSSLARMGHRFPALCKRDLGMDWHPVHGFPPAVTCSRCREHRDQLGPGTAPGCPGSCCAAAPAG